MQLQLAGALTTGIMTKALSERALGRYNLKFTTPATFMLSPRLALYTIEANAVSLYVSLVAAKRFGLGGGLREAALAGILTCLFQSSMDINGTRFVWWTWHDSAPTVRHRILGVPVLSSLLSMSLGSGYAVLTDWRRSGFNPRAERACQIPSAAS